MLNSCSAERKPGTVRGLKRGSVSVSGNSSNVQLQQSISWQPPSRDAMMYFIRYDIGVSTVQGASFNVTTPNTSILLTLSVPAGPLDMVVYNVWVAVVTEFKEQGRFEKLMIQYKCKLFIIIYRCAYALISSYMYVVY